MTQLVLASTLYGAATVAAAVESGALGHDDRRVLVVADTTAVPEIAVPLDERPGFDAVRHHFAAVHRYNDVIAPSHPSLWQPRSDDVPMLERALRDRWELGDGLVELVLESIQVPPARAVGTVFATSRVVVYADGLMTYGPTRSNIGPALGDRVRAVLHPDLIPGLRPALLTEYGTPGIAFDVAALRKVLDRTLDHVDLSGLPDGTGDRALVVGQFLAALDVLTAAEERRLHERMVAAAAAAGARQIWFKAHPSAPAAAAEALVGWASERGVELTLVPAAVPAEAIFAAAPPSFVVGCFSTALVTAARLYDIPAATVGLDVLLPALRPYENSNRVPATIIGAVLPDLELLPTRPSMPLLDAEVTAVRVQPLVDTVSFCMQPVQLASRRDDAVAWLAEHVDGPDRRYFARKRLTALGLPGAAPLPFVRQVVGPARRWVRRRSATTRKVLLHLRSAALERWRS